MTTERGLYLVIINQSVDSVQVTIDARPVVVKTGLRLLQTVVQKSNRISESL